eukprot:Gb_10122 [translate_table: standard]
MSGLATTETRTRSSNPVCEGFTCSLFRPELAEPVERNGRRGLRRSDGCEAQHLLLSLTDIYASYRGQWRIAAKCTFWLLRLKINGEDLNAEGNVVWTDPVRVWMPSDQASFPPI